MVFVGCGPARPPEFQLNLEGYDPAEISDAQRSAIRQPLERLFGTPDQPRAPEITGLDLALLEMAAGPVGSDEAGRNFGLYRKHCAECHGISGDGLGPTAAAQNPYPRDFRPGVFKYTRTAGGAKPVREDLDRVVRNGIPGTAMPAFNRLADEEIDALVEYVKYLSIRGETERLLVNTVVDLDDYPVPVDDVEYDCLEPVVALWEMAQAMVVVPPEPPPFETHEERVASITAGRELFLSEDAKCFQCHGPEGEGNGEQAGELYDDRNKQKLRATPEETRRAAALYRLPIQRLRPRDFTEGIFRGGDRPIDIYWRIYVGIKGTPMPANGPAPGSSGTLTEEEIWHVVNYVRSLSRAGGR